jgi:hypothetical protein
MRRHDLQMRQFMQLADGAMKPGADAKQNAARKALGCGCYASTGVHFITCGLPALFSLAGSSSMLLVLPHCAMVVVMIVAGVLLASSAWMEFRPCGCRRSRARIICLIFCAVLYTIGLAGHSGVLDAGRREATPAGMYHCHY